MTSNIHISWDGPFMPHEQIGIRHQLERAILDGQLRVCECGILLLMISRASGPASFGAHLACGCGSQSEDQTIALRPEGVSLP